MAFQPSRSVMSDYLALEEKQRRDRGENKANADEAAAIPALTGFLQNRGLLRSGETVPSLQALMAMVQGATGMSSAENTQSKTNTENVMRPSTVRQGEAGANRMESQNRVDQATEAARIAREDLQNQTMGETLLGMQQHLDERKMKAPEEFRGLQLGNADAASVTNARDTMLPNQVGNIKATTRATNAQADQTIAETEQFPWKRNITEDKLKIDAATSPYGEMSYDPVSRTIKKAAGTPTGSGAMSPEQAQQIRDAIAKRIGGASAQAPTNPTQRNQPTAPRLAPTTSEADDLSYKLRVGAFKPGVERDNAQARLSQLTSENNSNRAVQGKEQELLAKAVKPIQTRIEGLKMQLRAQGTDQWQRQEYSQELQQLQAQVDKMLGGRK